MPFMMRSAIGQRALWEPEGDTKNGPFVEGARIIGVLLAIVCVMCPQLATSASDTAMTIDIGKGEIGVPPVEFELLPKSEVNKASWTVVRDATAKAGIAIQQAGVKSVEEPTLAIYKPASLKNGEISLRLHAIGGASSQGGGVACASAVRKIITSCSWLP
jgi:hypothetical protein